MGDNAQKTPSNKKPATGKEVLQVIARPLIFILFLIMICSFFAHYLTGSETLQEYAINNPETAYGNGTESDLTDDTASESGSTGNIAAESVDTVSEEDTVDNPDAYNIPTDTAEEALSDTSEGNEPEDDTTASSTTPKEENDTMTANTERITYQDGFYYEPLSDSIKKKITGISYPENGCTIPYEDLNYVKLLYIDFDGEVQTGELICNKAIAQDMVEIFYELYRNDYRIERVCLIDEYDGDDTLSMLDNNTSCFNYRVVDGTTTLSKHALGCAIDINPFYNPYVVFNKNGSGETYISPKGSEIYADRSQNFPYKIDENDLCYKLFTQHGFTWGGNWNSTKDYQHFQIVLP